MTLPATVVSVSLQTFDNCPALTEVSLGSITTISNAMFLRCTSLEKIDIPNSVTMIDTLAFGRCSALKSVSMPVSVTYIANQVFSYCGELNEINYAGTMEQWNKIEKDENWAQNCNATIKCTDGDISL